MAAASLFGSQSSHTVHAAIGNINSLDELVDVLHGILIVLAAHLLAVNCKELRLLACNNLRPAHLH